VPRSIARSWEKRDSNEENTGNPLKAEHERLVQA
jgi:hypothetical protein